MADEYRQLKVSADQIDNAVNWVEANKDEIEQDFLVVENCFDRIAAAEERLDGNSIELGLCFDRISTAEVKISKLESEQVEVDSDFSDTSENPVQNKVITEQFSHYYTTAETDEKITEKVSEIVAGAPDDFNTLKEMSDWLLEHEDSAATMNSAIQKNASDISIANAAIQKNKTDILSANAEIVKKVDKVSGKSLISDSEIERLASVDNYDDTAVTAQIAGIYDNYIGGKNLLNPEKHTRARCTEAKDGNTYTVTSTGTWSQWAWKFKGLSGQTYALTFEISELTGDTSKNDAYIADVNSDEKIRWFTIRENGAQTINFTATSDGDINIAFNPNYTDTVKDLSFKVSNLMCRPTKIKSKSYAPYRPTVDELQDQINALTARIAALEGTATIAEGGE